MLRYAIAAVALLCTAAAAQAPAPPNPGAAQTLATFLRALETSDTETAGRISTIDELPIVVGSKILRWETPGRSPTLADLERAGATHGPEYDALKAEADALRVQCDDARRRLVEANRVEDPAPRLEANRDATRLCGELDKRTVALEVLDGPAAEARLELELAELVAKVSLGIKPPGTTRVESQGAIVDLRLQSQGGALLQKRHRIELQRATTPAKPGRWIVTSLREL
jgi:hypothetical protein